MYKFRLCGWMLLSFFVCSVISPITAWAQGSGLESYAGTGQPMYQDRNRNEAAFFCPYSLIADQQGNIILADSYNHRIRKIVGDEVITIAGMSKEQDEQGFPIGGYWDGGALQARFNQPRGVAMDSQGNIYVADTGNNVIRKISQGQVFTFTGTGQAGYRDGKGNQAQFNQPTALVIDREDNLYVADTLNNVIRKINLKGEASTLVGKSVSGGGYKDGACSEALFNEPSGLALGRDGQIYILDSGNQLLRVVTGDQVKTVAGKRGGLLTDTFYAQGGCNNGPVSQARFNFPRGIAIAANGIILIADTWNHRVRAITPGREVLTLVDTGIGTLPVGLLLQKGKLYISDMEGHRVWAIPFDENHLQPVINLEPSGEKIQIWVAGERIAFPGDQEAFIENGRTIVPLRLIGEELGAKVEWFPDGKIRVTRGEVAQVFTADQDALIFKNNKAMIPLRDLLEKLNLKANWVPDYRAVFIGPN